MQDTWVPSLGREDPLGKEMTTHSSTLAWKIRKSDGLRSLVGYSPWGRKESDMTERLHYGGLGLIPGLGRSPEEGIGYPLQYSGLENSMDCVVHGVAKREMTERL